MSARIADEYLYTLCFADNKVFIAQDENDLKYMLQKFIEEAGLKINRIAGNKQRTEARPNI